MGSQSKLGADFPVKAYKLSENRYTLEDIKASIPSCKVDLAPLYEKPRRKSTVTLEEAKELYPDGMRSGSCRESRSRKVRSRAVRGYVTKLYMNGGNGK